MKRTLSIILFFPLVLHACAAPTSVHPILTATPAQTLAPIETSTPMPSVTATLPVIDATSTSASPLPLGTPSPANGSPTPSIPRVLSPDGQDVQCHTGPGIEFTPAFTFQTAEIVGKDRAGQWWYIQMFDKLKPVYCWVNTESVRAAGNLASVPVTEAEQASVTEVNLSIEGEANRQVVCGLDAAKPEFHFNAKIVTNGPIAKLKYAWSTDAGNKFTSEQIQVSAWDKPAQPNLSIVVPAQEGSYSLTLRTISPNEVVGVAQFSVKCW